MGRHPIGSAEHSALAVGVADLDVLLGAKDIRENCWENRTHAGTLTSRALYEAYDCANADLAVAQLIANVARSILSFEPGLAETGLALADETRTAVEQHDVVLEAGDCPGPLPEAWTKRGAVCIPAPLQWAFLGLGALVLYRGLR